VNQGVKRVKKLITELKKLKEKFSAFAALEDFI